MECVCVCVCWGGGGGGGGLDSCVQFRCSHMHTSCRKFGVKGYLTHYFSKSVVLLILFFKSIIHTF